MKMSNNVICILLLFFITACVRKNINKNSNGLTKENQILLDSVWQLRYRIPNCDSALVFMKQVIEPVQSFPRSDNPLIREREAVVRIPGENITIKDEGRYKFYINPDCLVGRPAITALDIFCHPDSLDSFLAINQKFMSSNESWFLLVRGFGNYLGIKFKEGFIISAKYSEISSSH